MSDWVPAYRQMFATDHWLAPCQERPASRRDAWLDLLQMAVDQPRETRYGPLLRGQFVGSVRTFAERWFWSKSAVSRFLDELTIRGTLGTGGGTPLGTVYTVAKYDTYAIPTTEVGDTTRDTSGTPYQHPDAPKKRKRSTAVAKYVNGDDPAKWMHDVWQTALGNGHPLSLTSAREQKYRQMYEEQLNGTPDPKLAWTACLEAVRRDEFKMGNRAFVMPESLLRNPERRSQRVDEAVTLIEGARKKSTAASDFATYYRARQGQ